VLLDVSLEEAQKLLLQNLNPLATEKLSILDASGRVLAENLVAGENLPAWSSGARDGYVLHANDLDGHRKLSIVGTLSAEQLPLPLNSGETIEVRTGGVIPHGGTALVPHEEVKLGELKSTWTKQSGQANLFARRVRILKQVSCMPWKGV